jgi:multidrug efflux pump
MTTFATVLGVWPLIIASGPGANSRFSIGMMITAGMMVGTLFTLFVVPAFYLPFTKKGRGRKVRFDEPSLEIEPGPA